MKTRLGKIMRRAGYDQIMFSDSGYSEWRLDELKRQFRGYFRAQDVEHKDVLDFGCGTGELSMLAGSSGAGSVTGVDLDAARISAAQRRVEDAAGTFGNLQFIHAPDPSSIPLSDGSVDVILCFDVLEHVMHVRPIFNEWYRVLRPQGKVLIWWVPWLHPVGHHIESLVPIPWAHALFSERALVSAAARIYDSADFQPRVWDIDVQTGTKKPNKWKQMSELPEVNRLTIRGFEELISRTQFKIADFRLTRFQGSTLSRLTNLLLRSKLLREYFCASVTCTLFKP